ncbi:MAG: hypothetical protein KDB02_10930, partial [Acidimicrobiales bacterium]|nr:hypothetical protein [Acidimicrobiales bacterium]
ARNGRIVGSSQEGYRNNDYAVGMAGALALAAPKDPFARRFTVKVVKASGGHRWHLVASNGRKVFGSHEVLTKRAHAERMAYRVLTEAHELEVRG